MAKQDPEMIARLVRRRFDRTGEATLHRQLYDILREAIADGELSSGARLPSSRLLAEELGVSRHTVLTALERLLGDGYLVGHRGSGTYVGRRPSTPGDRPEVQPRPVPGPAADRGRRLSRRATTLVSMPRYPLAPAGSPNEVARAFRVGLPAVDHFPKARWLQALAASWNAVAADELGWPHPFGHRQLREATAGYLWASRGLAVNPEQVVIVAGTHSAIDLCLRLLLDPGDTAAIEDPGYLGTRAALAAAEARAEAVPVDEHGFDVAHLLALERVPRLAVVTPTYQFPLGVTLSADRRMALARWAERHDTWVLEVDFYSEFDHGARPVEPLAAFDRAGRVIYVGTFNNLLFPSLGIGYLVIPPDLVEVFEAADFWTDLSPSMVGQAALARFIEDGHFSRHLRHLREIHAERRQVLVGECRRHLAGKLDIRPASTGLHLLGQLPDASDDLAVARAAGEREVDVWALSLHAVTDRRRGLVLGCGAVAPALIRLGVEQLAKAIECTA